MTDPGRLVLPGPDLAWRDEAAVDDRPRRAAYRAWVREHHPDRGGDPTAFAQGLQVWQRTLRDPAAGDSAGRATPAGSVTQPAGSVTGPAGGVTFHRTRRSSPLTWWAARRAERARPARVR